MGRFERLAKLGGLTTRVTSSYVGAKLKEAFVPEALREKAREKLHVDNAREIVATMSRMKGAAMKLGQQLALASSALDLPPEVTQLLGTLNADGEPVPFDEVRASVERSLEAPLSKLFRDFDPAPLGSASLGQAHVARLRDGTEVVVKVRHAGVEHSVETDLLALKAVLLSGRVLRRSRQEIDEVFDEIRARLLEELDYLQEAANIEAYQRAFADDPDIRVPRLYPALCTDCVLTMDRLPGRHLDAWLPTATEEARQRAGATLAELYYRQLFRLRMLHADPHIGNFLFEPDGRVGLVDFGCIKRFDPYFMSAYAEAALAAYEDDPARGKAACARIGAWDGETEADGEVVWQFCRVLGHGFRQGVITLGDEREQLLEEVLPVMQQLVANPRVRLPKDVLFGHRALGGMYTLGRRIGTRTDFGAVLLRHVHVAIAAGQG